MSFVGNLWDDLTGQSAADTASAAATEAGDANLAFQQQALDYMMQQGELPTELRDASMTALGGLMGLPGYETSFQDSLATNPLYQAQLDAQIGGIDQMQQQSQDAMMAQAAATGGLRGGNYQAGTANIAADANLAKSNATANAMNTAYQQQLSGLGGLAGLNTGSSQIAGQMGNMGNIAGQSIIGANQSANAAKQAGMGNMMGLGGLGLQAFSAFSDERLKSDIVKIGEKNGLPWYTWTWNEKANAIDLHGDYEGHMAGEVEAKYPDAVTVDNSGYKKVNYGALHG